MDMNIILWIGGTCFSLGIFAVKVGTGLGCGQVSRKNVGLILGLYLGLFELIALSAGQLLRILEPLLRGGPWLHGGMALGMILWGLTIVMRPGTASASTSSLMLLIPCPVCLSAMTFSTWAALQALPLPPWAVGLLLGAAFGVMTLLVMAFVRARAQRTSTTSLGLAMMAIGLYFIAALFLPDKVEQAKGMYRSFINELPAPAGNEAGGLLLLGLLSTAVLIGFFARKEGAE